MNSTASKIVDLLAVRHSKDVFVPECKTGPTQGVASCPRLDAWAMTRSWVSPAMYGYEVKVARSDFLQDDKWQSYLPYCNMFSFVCPANLITVDEIPDGVGLIWASKNLGRLYTKRKAKRRQIEEPADLFLYVMMARSRIVAQGDYDARGGRVALLAEWLENGTDLRRMGHLISEKLQRVVREKIDAVETENGSLVSRIGKLEAVQSLCESMGLDVDRMWRPRDEFRKALAEHEGYDVVSQVNDVVQSLSKLRDALTEELPKREEKTA